VFWERELTTDELKEILRFRRLARYATMLQSVGMFGLKVPMPKVPLVIEELVREAKLQHQMQSSPNSTPKLDASTIEEYQMDPIALPQEVHDTSPKLHQSKKSNLSVASVEDIYTKKANSTEQFEFTNPSLSPTSRAADSTPPVLTVSTSEPAEDKKRLSSSQKAAMQNVGKVLRLDSPRLGHAIHKTRSKRSRARKRVASHSILQPWFAILYFLIPLTFLASLYFVPFVHSVYMAWKDQKAFRAAVEVPYFFERLLRIPDIPILQSTVFIGLFAVEVTSIIYVSLLIVSQLMVILIVRPLILSLSTSFSEKGAGL